MAPRVPKLIVELDYDTIEGHFVAGEAGHTGAITRAPAAKSSAVFTYFVR